MPNHALLVALATLSGCGPAPAVTPAPVGPVPRANQLADYTGVYEYRDGQSVALASVDGRVLGRMPYESYAHPDPRKQALTLGDLLTMRSGMACNDWDRNSPGNEVRVYEAEDWAKFVLDLPMLADPGQEARYCSGGVKVAGRMVEEATGEPLPTFAERVLFDPLGAHPMCGGTSRFPPRTRGPLRNCTCVRDMLEPGLGIARRGGSVDLRPHLSSETWQPYAQVGRYGSAYDESSACYAYSATHPESLRRRGYDRLSHQRPPGAA